MLTKIISAILIIGFVNFVAIRPAIAVGDEKTKAEKKAAKLEAKNKKRAAKIASKEKKRAAKVKKHSKKIRTALYKLGTGRDARIKVKLRDKTKIKGYLQSVGEESFTVIDENGNAHIVKYPETKQVKGNNLSTGMKILIGVGAAAAVILLIIFLAIVSRAD